MKIARTFEQAINKWSEFQGWNADAIRGLLLRYIKDCDEDRVAPSGEFRRDVCTPEDLDRFLERVARAESDEWFEGKKKEKKAKK
jgi:hypothetical protein